MKGLRTFFTLLSGAVYILHFEYGIKPARDTKNFEKDTVYSGNRCKFTSMFICASPALPCAGVACCQTKFQVPLTAFKMHPHFDEQSCDLSNIGKTVFITERKTCTLELRYFIAKKEALWIIKNQSVRNYSFCNRLYIDN